MGRSTSAVRRERDRLLGAVNNACRILVEYSEAAARDGGSITPGYVPMLAEDVRALHHGLDSARRAVTGVIFTPKQGARDV